PVLEGPATVSPPMALRTISGGRLRLGFSARAKGWRKKTLITHGETPSIVRQPFTQNYWALNGGEWRMEDGVYRGEAPAGWQTADLGLGAENIEFSARVTLHSGAAVGFVFRPDARLDHAGSDQRGDFVFYLDAETQQVAAARLPAFLQPHVRALPVEYNHPYTLRLCIRRPRFEVYVDDILALQGALDWQAAPTPSVGLLVDRGSAEISELELYELG
ncbi:MAG: hypothetical protein IH586_03190, partial [Anaerolineaceae bacterium]|nr:hypothetical protein [Anaerolineaceae bacterium]